MGYEQPGMKAEDDNGISCQPDHIRQDFIRKVYTILSFQLLLTTIIAYSITSQPTTWIRAHMFLYQGAQLITMGTLIGVTCCCSHIAKQFPLNYAFLGVITVGMGVTTGFVSSMYTADSVVMAMGATCCVFFSLTALAICTKIDFTGMGAYLMAAVMSLMAFGFMMMLFSMITGNPVSSGIRTLYAAGGVVIFSMYIVYDTQLIVGGSHRKHQFSVDDYVFAALNIYLDIINLFLFLLELFGERR